MKQEYEAVEEQVDGIEAAIEKAKSQLNETTMLKQQLENQIALLREQIHSAHMNDEHYDQRPRPSRQSFWTGRASWPDARRNRKRSKGNWRRSRPWRTRPEKN